MKFAVSLLFTAMLSAVLVVACNVGPVNSSGTGSGGSGDDDDDAATTPTDDPNCTDIDGDGYCAETDDCNDLQSNENPGMIEDCGDGLDNDCNGDVDCDDVLCVADIDCNRPETETDCGNGLDDDADGAADCQDFDCYGDPGCGGGGNENCTDQQDNDGDGLVDCLDPDCGFSPDCTGETNCSDGIDDDGDGLVDCSDPECQQIDPIGCGGLFPPIPDCCNALAGTCTDPPTCETTMCANAAALITMGIMGINCCSATGGAWSGECAFLAILYCNGCQ